MEENIRQALEKHFTELSDTLEKNIQSDKVWDFVWSRLGEYKATLYQNYIVKKELGKYMPKEKLDQFLLDTEKLSWAMAIKGQRENNQFKAIDKKYGEIDTSKTIYNIDKNCEL